MVIVGEFVGGAALGAAIGVLFDAVNKAVDKSAAFKSLFENIKFSLEILKPVIEKIGNHNLELGLPDEETEYILTEMMVGAKLVQRASKVSKWNCMKSYYYTDQLIKLDASLKRLLHILIIKGVRDGKETLILARKHQVQLSETTKDAKETLVIVQNNSSQLAESVKDGKETLELATKYAEQSARDRKETLVLARKIKRLLKRMVPCTNKGKTRYIKNRFPKASRRSRRSQSIEASDLRVFCFAELQAATENFSGNMIGHLTYKGWLDEKTLAPSKFGTGMMVAIKRYPESYGGEFTVNFLECLSHPNFVKLLGYCCEEKEILFVYEFVQRGSLKDHRFGRSTDKEKLSWDNRLKIAIGAARGLTFLHSLQVVHRNVKPSKLLLDKDYNAKLSDFFLAMKSGSDEEESESVSTPVAGTIVYIDPEYLITGRVSVKSDVYSFGVVLLEILTGLKSIDHSRSEDQHNLVEWARPLLCDETELETIMDEQMKGQCSFC